MDAVAAMFAADAFGKPIWLWATFLSGIAFLLWLDLGVLHRKSHAVSPLESAFMWSIFATAACAFGVWVWIDFGPVAGAQFFTGYVLETSLAFDNIFVISTIFAYFGVPRAYQHRVLFWGIIGAIAFRAIFIGAGAAIVARYVWVLYIFAAFLIVTGIRMATARSDGPDISRNPVLRLARALLPVTDRVDSDRFFVKLPRGRKGRLATHATPLLLALLVVEFVDIVFAVDSVPAIFAVTQDPFIVYTSNIFAILGLRSMYFMLAAAIERFQYLKAGLSVILVLIGVKIFWNFGIKDLGLDASLGWQKIDPMAALIVTLAILVLSVIYSLLRTHGAGAKRAPAE